MHKIGTHRHPSPLSKKKPNIIRWLFVVMGDGGVPMGVPMGCRWVPIPFLAASAASAGLFSWLFRLCALGRRVIQELRAVNEYARHLTFTADELDAFVMEGGGDR